MRYRNVITFNYSGEKAIRVKPFISGLEELIGLATLPPLLEIPQALLDAMVRKLFPMPALSHYYCIQRNSSAMHPLPSVGENVNFTSWRYRTYARESSQKRISHAFPARFKNSASSITSTPNSFAFSSLLPAFSPATTKLVFLLTLPDALPPSF